MSRNLAPQRQHLQTPCSRSRSRYRHQLLPAEANFIHITNSHYVCPGVLVGRLVERVTGATTNVVKRSLLPKESHTRYKDTVWSTSSPLDNRHLCMPGQQPPCCSVDGSLLRHEIVTNILLPVWTIVSSRPSTATVQMTHKPLTSATKFDQKSSCLYIVASCAAAKGFHSAASLCIFRVSLLESNMQAAS